MRSVSSTWSSRRAVDIDLRALVITLVLAAGFFRGWSQGSLSSPVSVFHLRLDVPTLPVLAHISWGWLLLLGWLCAAAGSLISSRMLRARALLFAGVLTLSTALGFVLLTAGAGGVRLAQLSQDSAELSILTKTMGYTVLRPNVTVLGPFAIPQPASLVFSSLRSGWYLSVICALLLLWRARAARANSVSAPGDTVHGDTAPAHGDTAHGDTAPAHGNSVPTHASPTGGARPMRWLSALVYLPALVLAWGLVAAAISAMLASRAADNADAGNYRAALSHLHTAAWFNSARLADPENANRAGTIELSAGQKSSAESQFALSRQQVTAGHTLDALRTLAGASDLWPRNVALRAELVTQSVSYVTAHSDPWLVRSLVPSRASSPLLKLVLAKYELDGGDNPTVLLDSRAAVRDSGDRDVKSAGLTLQSLALTRAGDTVAGRTVLVAAIAMDHDFVNVMARSLAAGRYTTVQP